MASNMFGESAIQRVAESKIKAAIEEGDFENLPGLGKPFEFDELNYDPNWWIKRKIERENLKKLFKARLIKHDSTDPS